MEISSDMLQKMKNIQLEILIELDRVCKELGINYTISSGTLIGAIRHKGFIPWDDDIDVAMLREDYDKFMEKGQDLLNSDLFIQNYKTDKHYPLHFGKIRNKSTVLVEYSTKKLKMKNGIYIDIFPIDSVSSNKFARKVDNILISIIWCIKFSSTIEWAMKSSSHMRRAFRIMLFPLAKLISPQKLNKIETLIRVKNNNKENKYTYADNSTLPPYRLKNTMLMPIEYFRDYEEVEFEHKKFSAISEWDSYLKVMYGQYMELPPVEHQISLHDIVELRFND